MLLLRFARWHLPVPVAMFGPLLCSMLACLFSEIGVVPMRMTTETCARPPPLQKNLYVTTTHRYTLMLSSLRRSTGRCGTHFLSQLLATAPGVVAFHEASPNLSGHDTLLAAATAPEESYTKRRHKAEAMLRSARRLCLAKDGFPERAQEAESPRPHTYVETSHLFLKTFSDVVMVSV